jgi:hypothetical protein
MVIPFRCLGARAISWPITNQLPQQTCHRCDGDHETIDCFPEVLLIVRFPEA